MTPRVSNQIRTVLDGFRIVPAYVLLGLLKHLVPLPWLFAFASSSLWRPRRTSARDASGLRAADLGTLRWHSYFIVAGIL